jgi:hypothetical protein
MTATLGGGPEALEDRPSAPSRVWNRIPTAIHDQIIEMALEQSELSPRELVVRFTDQKCESAWGLGADRHDKSLKRR